MKIETVHRPYQVNLTEREFNTIIAALRFWKIAGLECAGGQDFGDECSEAYKIAAGNWPKEDESLHAHEVQALWERMETGD